MNNRIAKRVKKERKYQNNRQCEGIVVDGLIEHSK